ncbi:MAG: hypothetical protein ACYS8Z_03075 [Planctomycetota bacterium]|jgi:hypothetical protein
MSFRKAHGIKAKSLMSLLALACAAFPALPKIALPAQSNSGFTDAPIIASQIDFDQSGALDFNDLYFFAEQWLWSGPKGDNLCDLSYDGRIDFEDFADFSLIWARDRGSVAIFVDSDTYAALPGRIGRLRADIGRDLAVHAFVFENEWTSIEQIKDIIIDKYENDRLIGVLLIGDIPTAYFEYNNSGSLPSDWYFQDLSDKFVDSDGDGKFEREFYLSETDVTMRDIWAGRIKPPAGGSQGITLLKNYLDRNHAYRTGGYSYNRRMLYFGSVSINQNGMSEQEYFDIVNQIDDYTGLYQSDAQVDAIYDPDLDVQKTEYLSEMSGSRDFLFVNIHGSPHLQWLGGSTNVFYSDIAAARPGALFSVLASCSNGDFTTTNYLAGWHLFNGSGLALTANSVDAMLIGATSVEFLYDFIPLRLGVTFGDMHMNDRSFLFNHLLGDPTLTLRPKPNLNLPRLTLDKIVIDFGTVVRGSKPVAYIEFSNDGFSPVTVSFKKGRWSIDGEDVHLGYWDVFYYEHPNTGQKFRDIEILPGRSKTVPFTFYSRSDGPVGTYTMTMLFQTNDPHYPYVKIALTGVARLPDIED